MIGIIAGDKANALGARPTMGLARYRHDLVAFGLYAVAVLGFFWQLLFVPDVFVPKGGGDLVSFLYPTYAFAAENIQRGIFPLWNPYLFSGSPFAADMQSGVFYPPNLVAFYLIRPFTYQTLEALAVGHYFLAACFTYLLARGFGIARIGAFAAGLIFAFGGFAVAHLAHYNMLAAAVWLPLTLLLLHRSLERASLRWAAACGVTFGISILAGHTQISLYTAFLLLLYCLWRLVAPMASSSLRVRLWPLASLLLSFAVAAGVAAVQLVPLVELLQRSLRSDLSYARALEFAASPLGLITLFVPHFFGDSPADYWGLNWSLTEVYGYVGILTWPLAAVVVLVQRPKNRALAFFVFLALFSLLVSLGEHTALYGWLYRFVPGFDKVRAAGRFLLLFDLSLAIIAGQGVAMLAAPLRARWRPAYSRFVRALSVLLAAAALVVVPVFYYAMLTSQDKDPAILRRVTLALDSLNLAVLFFALSLALLVAYRWRFRPGLAHVAVGLLLLDLFSANVVFNPTTGDVLKGFRHPAIAQYLQTAGAQRIDSATGIADVWQPDIGLLYGIRDVLGLFNPMTLADYQRYWENLGSRSVPGYDLLAAKYLIGRKDVAIDRQKFGLAFDGDAELNVYRSTNALPRVFLVGQGIALPRDEQLARLRSPDFDPRHVVLLESIADVKALAYGSDVRGTAMEVPGDDPNEVRLRVENADAAYLVLSDVYYPGWRAFVDGQETPVLRANYTFRALLLPAGTHDVRFAFQPALWHVGLAASMATVLVLAASMLLLRKKRYLDRQQALS